MAAEISTDKRNGILALFPELLGVGGIQEAGRLTLAALAEIASAHRHWLEVLSLNDLPGPGTLPAARGSIPFSGFGRAKARFAIAALAKVRRGAKIVLAAHPHLAVPAAPLKLFRPNLKLALIAHGIEVRQRLPLLRRGPFLSADVFMAPSRYTVDQIVEIQGAARAKVKQVPWPLSPNVLRMIDQPNDVRAPGDFPEGLTVLTVARLVAAERYKGVDHLMGAIAQLVPHMPTLHLVVVGGGDDLPRHRALAAKLGIAPRVHFLDNLSHDQVLACHSKCDVFALPSTGEGFGFVFLEAMAFAKPVIGAAAGGTTDIIEHGRNGLLVSPDNRNELVEALERLLLNDMLRLELGRNGAQLVRAKYQFENFRRDLEQVLIDCGLASNQPE